MSQLRHEAVDRLLRLLVDIERELRVDEDARDMCAIARGHLELTSTYDEPLDVIEVEKVMADAVSNVGEPKWRRLFLLRLRRVAGFIKLAIAAESGLVPAPPAASAPETVSET